MQNRPFLGIWVCENQSLLQSVTKYLRLTLVFMWNSAPRENLIAIFRDLVLTKVLFWEEDWTLGIHSMEFRHFPDIS